MYCHMYCHPTAAIFFLPLLKLPNRNVHKFPFQKNITIEFLIGSHIVCSPGYVVDMLLPRGNVHKFSFQLSLSLYKISKYRIPHQGHIVELPQECESAIQLLICLYFHFLERKKIAMSSFYKLELLLQYLYPPNPVFFDSIILDFAPAIMLLP